MHCWPDTAGPSSIAAMKNPPGQFGKSVGGGDGKPTNVGSSRGSLLPIVVEKTLAPLLLNGLY